MITKTLSKSELLELLVKGRKAGSTVDQSKLISVWRFIYASDKKPHWKRVRINPDNLSSNPKFTRVVKGEESKLSNNHPLKFHTADPDIPPDIPELTEGDVKDLQAYLETVHHEEEHKARTKAANQKVVTPLTTLTPNKPTDPPTTTGLNPLKITKAKTAAQNYIRTAPWNLKRKYTADKDLDEKLFKQLVKWDIYYYRPPDIKPAIFHNQLVTTLAVAIYHGFDPQNPQTVSNLPKELRVSYYEAITETTDNISDKLDIQKYTSPREQKLAQYINNLATLEDVESCTRTGIIPQDSHSQDFIVNQFQTRLALAVLSKDSLLDDDIREQVLKSWGPETVEELAKRATFDTKESADSFDRLITKFVQILDNGELGYSPKLIIQSLKGLRDFSLDVISNPQNHITVNPVDGNFSRSPIEIIEALNDAYSDNVTDEYKGDYLTNLGYTGNDPAVYQFRSLSSDGFIRYLGRLVQEEPQLKEEADKLIKDYVNLMNLAKNNPNLLKSVLSVNTWNTSDNEYNTNIDKLLAIYESLKSSTNFKYETDTKMSDDDPTKLVKLQTVRLRQADDDILKDTIVTSLLATAPRHILDGKSDGKHASSIIGDDPIEILDTLHIDSPETERLKEHLEDLIGSLTNDIDFTTHRLVEPAPDMSILDFGTSVPKDAYQASLLLGKVDRLTDTVIQFLEEKGKFSKEAIAQALRDSIRNDTLSQFTIAGKTISFNKEELDNGKANPFCIRNDDVVFGKYKQIMDIKANLEAVRTWRHLPAFYGNASAHWGQYMLHLTRSKFYKKYHITPVDDLDALEIKAAEDAYSQASQIAGITKDNYNSIVNASLAMLGKTPDSQSLEISNQKQTILTNLLMTTLQHEINSSLADNAVRNSKSKTNQYASDYSGTYDYYSGSVMKQIPTASTRYLPVGFFSNRSYDSFTVATNRSVAKYRKQEAEIQQSAMTERISQKGSITTITAEGLSKQIADQLKNTPIWSEKYIRDVRKFKQDSSGFTSDRLMDYANSPLKDVLLSVAHNSMYYMPKLRTKVHYSTYVASRLKDHPKSQLTHTPINPVKLKQAREACLQNAKYSIKALSREDTLDLWERLKELYDYKPGEKTLEGTIVSDPKYSVRGNRPMDRINGGNVYNTCALLNRPIFAIEEVNGDRFKAEQARLSDPKASQEITGFYGGSYSDLVNTPMDFSSKLGGAAISCGSAIKGYRDKNPNQEKADGIVMVASVMRGENYNNIKDSKSSIIVDAKPKSNSDWSISIRNPDLVLPKYLLDVSTRIKGYNVEVNENGFTDRSNGIKYTDTGVSTKINW